MLDWPELGYNQGSAQASVCSRYRKCQDASDRSRTLELQGRCYVVSTARTPTSGALMQHVELAGVHSGDSACVLPAPSLTATQENEISDTVRAIAKGLRRRGPDLAAV